MSTLSSSLGLMSQSTPFQNRQGGNYASRYPSAFLQKAGLAFSQQGPMSENTADSASLNPQSNQAPVSEPKKAKTDEKKADVGALGFLFPVMALIGAPLMLFPSLLGVKKNNDDKVSFELNKGSRWLATQFLKSASSEQAKKAGMEKILLSAYKWGQRTLAAGIVPKTIIGVMYGLQAQQPSIILAHILQLPLVAMIMRGNKAVTTLVYAMGGLFTLGFINDVQNGLIRDGKKPGTKEKIREYDMTHFKALFGSHSGLSAGQRIGGFFTECWKMLKFSAGDHVISSKRAFNEVSKFIHGEKNDLTDVRTNASISKSSLGFMLSYAATIPALLAAAFIKNGEGKAAKWLSGYSMTTTLLSGLMLNFGMILVALGGKSWAERIPLFGTSMEMGGTVLGYSTNSVIQPIALALQQLGGGFNSIFYAAKAQKD